MAAFTMYLWEVLELNGDSNNGETIGLGDYPIPAWWDDNARFVLNHKIIDHYRNREIGMPTISQFRLAVSRRMREVMPFLIQVYDSTRIQFDPLSTYNLETRRTDTSNEDVTRTSENAGDSTTTSQSRSVNSNTPQTMLSGNEDYADSAADASGVTSANNSGTGTDTTNGTTNLNGDSRTTGYQGSAADLLQKYRATLLNVDMMVLDALDDCFMQIWDNNEEMLPQIGYYS